MFLEEKEKREKKVSWKGKFVVFLICLNTKKTINKHNHMNSEESHLVNNLNSLKSVEYILPPWNHLPVVKKKWNVNVYGGVLNNKIYFFVFFCLKNFNNFFKMETFFISFDPKFLLGLGKNMYENEIEQTFRIGNLLGNSSAQVKFSKLKKKTLTKKKLLPWFALFSSISICLFKTCSLQPSEFLLDDSMGQNMCFGK